MLYICAVHGVEYAFGAHDYPTSGVFEVDPRQCPGFRFRKSIFMGTTCLDPIQVREFMELNSVNYNGDSYHLIVKNCNHFCKDICYKLTGNSIPKWVNRLANIGNFILYRCFLLWLSETSWATDDTMDCLLHLILVPSITSLLLFRDNMANLKVENWANCKIFDKLRKNKLVNHGYYIKWKKFAKMCKIIMHTYAHTYTHACMLQ